MDITRDVMKMAREGKSLGEMRTVIVKRYGRFGPSTDRQKEALSAPAGPPSPPAGRASPR